MAVIFDAFAVSVTSNTASSPLAWAHADGATADLILAGFALDGATGITPANNPLTATYAAASMASVQNAQTGSPSTTSGYLAVLSKFSPATGSNNVSGSFTNTGMDEIIGGSLSFVTGGGSLGTPVVAQATGGGAGVTSGSITVATTSASSLVAVFVTNGSGGTAFTSGTSRFISTHGGTAAGGAHSINAATIAGTGGNVTVNWTQAQDFYVAIAVEVLPPSGVTSGPVFRQAPKPARAPYPPAAASRGGLIYGSAAPRSQDTSFATGRIFFGPGAPVVNPARGPVFRQAVQAVRARLPLQPLGRNSFRGRTASNKGAPVRNPVSGPRFTQKTFPVQAQDPLSQQRISGVPGPRGRVYGISPGGPVLNPVSSGPPFYPKSWPVQAQDPLPRRGRVSSGPGAPVANPNVIAVAGATGGPVRASLPPNPRGRVRIAPAVAAAGTPPVHSGPPFFPAVQAVRARLPVQPLRRGRVTSNPGTPARNPSQGPAFIQAPHPAQARIPQVFSRGRAAANPGAPAANPVRGPVFRQAASPARIRPALPPRGRTASNPGGPVRNPVPGGTGPVFYPRNTAKAQQPLPRRGICRAIRFGPLPANPSQGPVFTQATSPARARFPLPPRGRIASNPGGPVQNPVPGVTGPPFFPFRSPVRVHPVLPPRGRITSNAGAPARNPHQGAAFPAPHGPVQARIPLPPRGRTAGNPGIPVVPPLTPAPVYPLHGPVRARLPLPPRGRIASNPGGPVQNPVIRTGPPFVPLHWPARIRPSLPPRGRISANPGAPVRNPGHGPIFIPKDWPARARIPQNAPRGRTSGNPGGPVANIPFGNPLFRTGSPRFRWETGIPATQWETDTPVFAWDTGVPVV